MHLRSLPAVVAFLLAGAPHGFTQSLTNCPGVVISQIPTPSTNFFGSLVNRVYVADPCILVLSNGDYLASHALFGTDSGSGTIGRTRIFRSTNKGTNWSQVNGGAELTGILRGTLFEHDGAVYLLGSNKDTDGNIAVISKSTNGGLNWTAPSSLSSGAMATPDHVLPVNGRLWAASTTSAFYATNSADLVLSNSWTSTGGFPTASSSWLPGTGFDGTSTYFIGEGQMTHSPAEGLVILPKVRLLSYTAIARVNPVNGAVSFDPDRDFVPLPGGEKKFGVRYDTVSGKYFLIGNPILPAHTESTLARDLIRNTAAVFTSTDLRRWKLEKIFLYSSNLDYEGFQYFNFDFDGDDIVIAARTAFDVGGNKPPRGHDSNLLTFHRIPNFRNLSRDLYLKLEGGQVRLYERTQHTDAPLGAFALGTTFAGQALTNPAAMGVAADTVYVREAGGRILTFDLRGNFLGVAVSAPVTLAAADLDLPVAAGGATAWNLAGSGMWNDPQSWRDWNIAGAPGDIAVFGSTVASSATVTLDRTPLAWTFDSPGNFEGWTTTNMSSVTVTNGVLSGVPTTSDPQLTRLNLNFGGSDAPEVRVRMRVNASGSVPVDLFWGNSLSNSFSAARSLRVSYTNNGAFQDVVFPMTAAPGWNGERITRLRIDPVNGNTYTNKLVEIDSVSVPVPSDLRTLGGLRFTGPGNYTLAGNGVLQLAPGAGPARIASVAGTHTVSLPVQLAADAIADVGAGSSLTVSGALSGNRALTKTGAGTLSLSGANTRTGATTVSGGKLVITSPQLDGTVSLATAALLELAFAGTDSIGEFWLDGSQKWQGTWGAPGSGAAYETSALTGPGTLTVTSGSAPGYAGWAWQQGLSVAPGATDRPGDDPDGDNIPNLLEWILGGNPLVPDAPLHSPQASRTQAGMVITFTRADDSEATAASYVTYGTNLATWSEVAIGPASSAPNPDGVTIEVIENGTAPDDITVTLPASLAPQGRLFARLKAVMP